VRLDLLCTLERALIVLIVAKLFDIWSSKEADRESVAHFGLPLENKFEHQDSGLTLENEFEHKILVFRWRMNSSIKILNW
jgi:hypothetical protein